MNRPLLKRLKDRHAWHLQMAKKWRSMSPDKAGNNKHHASYHRGEAMKLARMINKAEATS